MKKRFLIIVLLAGFLNTQGFSQGLNTKKLDAFFDTLDAHNKVMGSFAVSKNGKMIYQRSVGYSNMSGEKIKANSSTLYHIGSITKMYTATMVFQLVEEGKIALNTTLDKFFPAIPNAKTITIETLLNHKNGLYDYVNDQKDFSWITKPQSRKIIIDEIAKGKPKFLPGEKFTYSNSGYYLLTCIIEKITGQTYNENLQKRICAKLHLNHTYSPANNELKKNEAGSFTLSNNQWDKITDIYFPNVVGVGDILSTPSDLILFTNALMDGKFISAKSLGAMKNFGDNPIGMGMMRVPFYKKIGFGHGGDTYGTHSIVAKYPEDSLTFSVCINGEGFPHNDISIGILSICYNENYDFPTFNTYDVAADVLMQYAGEYASKEMPLKITITPKEKKMFAQATGQSSFELEAMEKDKFRFLPAGIIMEFNPAKHELILKQGGGSYLFTKEK